MILAYSKPNDIFFESLRCTVSSFETAIENINDLGKSHCVQERIFFE